MPVNPSIDPRAVLQQSTAVVTNRFSKSYINIVTNLLRSLDYSKNPVFGVISLYMIYKYLDSVFKNLDEDLQNDVSEEVENAYLLGFAMSLMAYYNSIGKAYTIKSIYAELPELVDKTVLIKLKKVAMADLLHVTKNTDFMVKKFVQETMTKHLNIKQMKAMGREDLVNLIMRDLEKGNLKKAIEKNMVSIVDKAGRQWNTKTYVDMVVQTKVHQVYVTGMQDFAIKNNGNGDLARIPSNPLTVDACLPYQEMIISMTGLTTGYPTYEELKMTGDIFHPRCRHTPVPYWSEEQIPKDVLSKHLEVLAENKKVL